MEAYRNLWRLIIKTQKKRSLAVLVSFAVIFGNSAALAAAQIDIYCDRELGKVNKKVFGNNFIGYDPTTYENWTKEYYGYSDYGAGIWDPRLKQSVKEAINLAKASGVSVIRFPGGCGTHRYDWKKSIGNGRKYFLYGLDEFLKTCEEISAEPVITVSYFTGDEFDAAGLVEYLNMPSGHGYRWADLRAKNGHSQPYDVRYFEIGNEVWHGDHRKIKKVPPKNYAQRYLKYYRRMKAIDSSIRIGVVLYSDGWNKEVLGIIKDNMDFGIIHIYPNLDDEEAIAQENPNDIYREMLGSALLKKENELLEATKNIKEIADKNLSLAVTEYNGGISQNEPLPYRHCLGTALLNAELLRIFMKPANKILMANYWNFVNEYWGMIANGFNGDYSDLYDSYYKRPNYYVFQLYHEHFGDILIDTNVKCSSYNSSSQSIPFLSVNASKSRDGRKLYLIVVNKNMTGSVIASVQFKDFKAMKAQAWVLNGPGIESTNEKNHQEVGVKQTDIHLGNRQDGFNFVFQPHSLTAIEIEGGS